MKEETKAAFRAAIERHESQKAELERKKSQEQARLEERAIGARKLRDEVILTALKAIANEVLVPAGWNCTVRSGPSGISASLEVYKGEIRAVSGKRPAITFSIESNVGRLTLSEATPAQDVIGEPLNLSVLNEDFVNERVLRFFEKLSREGVGH